jgi:Flp pilus assembly protein TadG
MTTARHRDRTERGVVYVEFLMAFFPVFLLFLGVTQAALISSADIVVRHAAVVAARSAIVVLEDDPRHYGGQARGIIAESAGSSGDWSDRMRHAAQGRRSAAGSSEAASRLETIQRAAYAPLAALAPDPALFQELSLTPKNSVERAVGGGPFSRIVFGLAVYNLAAVAVTFPEHPGAKRFYTGSVSGPDVTVRLTYLYPCLVPIASNLMCRTIATLTGRRRLHDAGGASDDTPERRLTRELERVKKPAWLEKLALSGTRFVALRAEATLPLQKAGYTRSGRRGSS